MAGVSYPDTLIDEAAESTAFGDDQRSLLGHSASAGAVAGAAALAAFKSS